jgi:hypothetical protein
MPPVVSALLAFVVALFRSRASRTWKISRCDISSQSINIRSIAHTCVRLIVSSGRACLGSGQAGARPWQLVQPRTVIAWQRQRVLDYWRQLSQRGMPGRPPVAKGLCQLSRHQDKADSVGRSNLGYAVAGSSNNWANPAW